MNKKTKNALIASALSLLLCVSMLVGSTFAWFTDSATTGVNTIVAGNLDVGLQYSKDFTTWSNAEASTEIFDANALWEPGYTQVVYFQVKNLGDLAFNYRIGTNVVSNVEGVNKAGNPIDLTKYIKFGIVPVTAAFSGRDAALEAVANPISFGDMFVAEESLDAKNDTATFAMVVYMPGDTNNDANHNGTNVPSIRFGIQVIASQKVKENDSFGNTYDENAIYPDFAFTTYKTEEASTIIGKNFEATIPANAGLKTEDGTAVADNTDLVMQITENATVDSNVTVNVGEAAETYEITLKTANGEKVTSQAPITVELDIGKGRTGAISLYHNDVLVEGTAYDAETGILSFTATDFSPYTVVEALYTADTSWYNDTDTEFVLMDAADLFGFASLTNNGNKFSKKTVKLGADIDLNNAAWVPAATAFANAFGGTFDGQGYTISNVYCVNNLGNGNGFFGTIISGNVINVVFDNVLVARRAALPYSGNMYGIVSGYAYGTCTFENITVKNSAVYGYGKVAGILGMAADPNGVTTFKNCVVENTTIAGAYNCGGISGLVQNPCVLENCTVDVEWKKALADSQYITVEDTINNGALQVSGIFWDYGYNYLLSGWADYYTDMYYSDAKLDNSDYFLNEGLIHNK